MFILIRKLFEKLKKVQHVWYQKVTERESNTIELEHQSGFFIEKEITEVSSKLCNQTLA